MDAKMDAKKKPSLPSGEICQDAFGNVPDFLDRGIRQRTIIALGRQDIPVSSLKPIDQLKIIGSSSGGWKHIFVFTYQAFF